MNKNHQPKVAFEEKGTLIIAHRGLTSLHLENTLKALTSAFEIGADGVEFDVQLTEDLVPMVFHDRRLMRLVGVNKNIDDVSFDELSELTQKNSRYKGEYPISTLKDVLSALPENKLINVELKETIALKGAAGMDQVLKVLEPYKGHLKMIISSFDPEILAMVNAQDSDYSLGLLIDSEKSFHAYLKSHPILDKIDYLHPHIDLVTNTTSQWIKNRGLRLILWGHKKMDQELSFIADGHTGLISDVTEQLINTYHK